MELEADVSSLFWRTATLFGFINPAYVFHLWVIMFTYLGLVGAWVHYRNQDSADESDSRSDHREIADREELSTGTFKIGEESFTWDVDFQSDSENCIELNQSNGSLQFDRETQTDQITDIEEKTVMKTTATCELPQSQERDVTEHEISTNCAAGLQTYTAIDPCKNSDGFEKFGVKTYEEKSDNSENLDRFEKEEIGGIEKYIEIGFISNDSHENFERKTHVLEKIEEKLENLIDDDENTKSSPFEGEGIPHPSGENDIDVIGTDNGDVVENRDTYVGENFILCNKELNGNDIVLKYPGELDEEKTVRSETYVSDTFVLAEEMHESGLLAYFNDVNAKLGNVDGGNSEAPPCLSDSIIGNASCLKLANDFAKCEAERSVGNTQPNEIETFEKAVDGVEGLAECHGLADLWFAHMKKFDDVKKEFGVSVDPVVEDTNESNITRKEQNKSTTSENGNQEITETVTSVGEAVGNDSKQERKTNNQSTPAQFDEQIYSDSSKIVGRQWEDLTIPFSPQNVNDIEKWILHQNEVSENESEVRYSRRQLRNTQDDISIGYSEIGGNFREITDELIEGCSVVTDVYSEFPDGYSDIYNENCELNETTKEGGCVSAVADFGERILGKNDLDENDARQGNAMKEKSTDSKGSKTSVMMRELADNFSETTDGYSENARRYWEIGHEIGGFFDDGSIITDICSELPDGYSEIFDERSEVSEGEFQVSDNDQNDSNNFRSVIEQRSDEMLSGCKLDNLYGYRRDFERRSDGNSSTSGEEQKLHLHSLGNGVAVVVVNGGSSGKDQVNEDHEESSMDRNTNNENGERDVECYPQTVLSSYGGDEKGLLLDDVEGIRNPPSPEEKNTDEKFGRRRETDGQAGGFASSGSEVSEQAEEHCAFNEVETALEDDGGDSNIKDIVDEFSNGSSDLVGELPEMKVNVCCDVQDNEFAETDVIEAPKKCLDFYSTAEEDHGPTNELIDENDQDDLSLETLSEVEVFATCSEYDTTDVDTESRLFNCEVNEYFKVGEEVSFGIITELEKVSGGWDAHVFVDEGDEQDGNMAHDVNFQKSPQVSVTVLTENPVTENNLLVDDIQENIDRPSYPENDLLGSKENDDIIVIGEIGEGTETDSNSVAVESSYPELDAIPLNKCLDCIKTRASLAGPGSKQLVFESSFPESGLVCSKEDSDFVEESKKIEQRYSNSDVLESKYAESDAVLSKENPHFVEKTEYIKKEDSVTFDLSLSETDVIFFNENMHFVETVEINDSPGSHSIEFVSSSKEVDDFLETSEKIKEIDLKSAGLFDSESDFIDSNEHDDFVETSESTGSYDEIGYELLICSDEEQVDFLVPGSEKVHGNEETAVEERIRCSKEKRKTSDDFLETIEETEETNEEESLSECFAVAIPSKIDTIDYESISVLSRGFVSHSKNVNSIKVNWREISLALSDFEDGLKFLCYFRKLLSRSAVFVELFNSCALERHCRDNNVFKLAPVCAEKLSRRADFRPTVIHAELYDVKKDGGILTGIEVRNSKSTKEDKLKEGLVILPGCFGIHCPERADCVEDSDRSYNVYKPQLDSVRIADNKTPIIETVRPASLIEDTKKTHSEGCIKTKPRPAWECFKIPDDYVFLTSLAAVEAESFSDTSSSWESSDEYLEGETARFGGSVESFSFLEEAVCSPDEKHELKRITSNSEEGFEGIPLRKRSRSSLKWENDLLPVSGSNFELPFERKFEFLENEIFQRCLLSQEGSTQTDSSKRFIFSQNFHDFKDFIPENCQIINDNSDFNNANVGEKLEKSLNEENRTSEFEGELQENLLKEEFKASDMGQGSSVGYTKGTLAMPVSNYLLRGITVRNQGEYAVINYKNTRFAPLISVDRKIEITLNVPQTLKKPAKKDDGSEKIEIKNDNIPSNNAVDNHNSCSLDSEPLKRFPNKPQVDAEIEQNSSKSAIETDVCNGYVKSLDPGTVNHDEIPNVIDNGVVSRRDEIVRNFGEPVIAVRDNDVDTYPAELLNDDSKVETDGLNLKIRSNFVDKDGPEENLTLINGNIEKVIEENILLENVEEVENAVEEHCGLLSFGEIFGETKPERDEDGDGDNDLIQYVADSNNPTVVDFHAYDNKHEKLIFEDCGDGNLNFEENEIVSDSHSVISINIEESENDKSGNIDKLNQDENHLSAERSIEFDVIKLRSKSLSSLPDGHFDSMAWFYRNRPSSVCLEDGPSSYSNYGTLRRAKSAEISRRKPKIILSTNLERRPIKETNLDELMKSLEYLGPRAVVGKKEEVNGDLSFDTVDKRSLKIIDGRKIEKESHVVKTERIQKSSKVVSQENRKEKNETVAALQSRIDSKKENASVATLIERFESPKHGSRKFVVETRPVCKQKVSARSTKSAEGENSKNSYLKNNPAGSMDENNNNDLKKKGRIIVASSKPIVNPASIDVDRIRTQPCTTNATKSVTKDLGLKRSKKTKMDLDGLNNDEVGKTSELGIIKTIESSESNKPFIFAAQNALHIDKNRDQKSILLNASKHEKIDKPASCFEEHFDLSTVAKENGKSLQNGMHATSDGVLSSSEEEEVKRTSVYGLTIALSEQSDLEIDSKESMTEFIDQQQAHFWLEQCDGVENEVNGARSKKISDIDLVLKTPVKGSYESINSIDSDGGNIFCLVCRKKLGKNDTQINKCTSCIEKSELQQEQNTHESMESKGSRSRNSFRKDKRLRKWLEERQSSLQSEDKATFDDMDVEEQSKLLKKIARSKGIDIKKHEEHDVQRKRYSSIQSRNFDFLEQLRYLINLDDDDDDESLKPLEVTDKEQDAIDILKEYEMMRQLKKGRSPFTSDDEGNESDAFTDITDTSLSDYTRSRHSLNSLSLSHGSLYKSKCFEAGDEEEILHPSEEMEHKNNVLLQRQEDYDALMRKLSDNDVSKTTSPIKEAFNVTSSNPLMAKHDVNEIVVSKVEEKNLHTVEEQVAREFFSTEDMNGLINMANSAVRNRRNRSQRTSAARPLSNLEANSVKLRPKSVGALHAEKVEAGDEVFVASSEPFLDSITNYSFERFPTRSTNSIELPENHGVYEDAPWSLIMERLNDASYGNLRGKLSKLPYQSQSPSQEQEQEHNKQRQQPEYAADAPTLPSPLIRELKHSPQQKRRAASLRDVTPDSRVNSSQRVLHSVPASPPRYVRGAPFRKSTGSYDQRKKAHRSLPDLISKPGESDSPVRLAKYPSGGSSTFSISKHASRSPRGFSRQSPRSSLRSPVRSLLRSPRLSEFEDDGADCETVYSDFTACFSDSSLDVGIAADGYEMDDEDFFLQNSPRRGVFSPSFDDFLAHGNNDNSSDEYFVPLNIHSKRPEGRIITCAFGPCKNTDYADWSQRSQFTSCVSCFTYYCSKECRKADWKEHKLTCYYGRINYYTKALVRRFETNSEINMHLSKVALEGLEEHGRGCVYITFTSPMAAKFFLVSGTNSFVKEPVYVPLSEVLNEGIITKHQVLLQQTLQDYDPEFEFVINLTVFVGKQNQMVISPKSRFKTSALLRCSKVPLSSTFVNRENEPSSDSSYEIKVFYLPKSRSHHFVNEAEARRYYCREVSYGLRKYGIQVKKDFPDVYDKLCLYVEHDIEFVPITLYGQANGKNYKCVVFPEGFSGASGSVELQGRGMLV